MEQTTVPSGLLPEQYTHAQCHARPGQAERARADAGSEMLV